VVFCAFLGGAYPALLLSALNPAQVLRGQVVSSKSALFIRRGLVIFQFFLSISLLTTTLIVHEQLEYIQSRQLGFEKENVITFSANRKLRQVYPAFKNELLTLPGVAGVTASSSKLSFFDQSTSNVQWEGKDPDLHLIFHQLMVDPDFLDVFHIGLSAGRGFDKNIASDSTAIVLNNEAVKQMGLADPLYKKLIINDTHEGMVIGVVNDFNFKSAHKNIEPVVIYIDPSSYYEVSVRLVPGKLQEQVTSVEAIFKKFNPDWPFEYSFLDSDIENLYRTEQRISRIFNHLSRLSIFVSCLGLLGMVIFVADQRAKEVALRKVMGASSWHLTWLLSAEFIYLVLIAFLISTPIIYLGSSVWLNTFAYRITPGAKLFLTSGGISLAVAWAIVGYKSFRSGMANPIDTLRSE
jgi:putative ABC transport system permease protein